MSIDTCFKPTAATISIGTTPVAVSQVSGPGAVTTYRVRCLVAAYLSWGPTSAQATANAVAQAGLIAGTGQAANTVGMFASSVETFELPAGSFLVASAALAFEVTPGQGA